MDITYRTLALSEVSAALFQGFDRYQEVKRCWRKADGAWVLRDIAFVEQWGPRELELLAAYVAETLKKGGTLWVAFDGERLAGFAGLEREPLGPLGAYRQLSMLHVSRESRGRGLGRALLSLAADKARGLGAGKLYISAHSSQESQAFYKAVGCIEAAWYCERLAELEPGDCQLELIL